jgi:hypothetical protein
MRRFRFHIGTLLTTVLILGIAFAALRESNQIWDSGVFTLTAGVLTTSVLLAIHRTESKRAFSLGFALFGAAYLGLSSVASIEPRLVTTKLLAFIDAKLPRVVPVVVAYADVDSDGDVDSFVTNNSQPNAVFVNKGNGTFQDITMTVGVNYARDAATNNGVIVLNNSAGLGLVGTSANFMRIGHSICALIVALLGGHLSRYLYEKNRKPLQSPDSPQVSTLPVRSGE